MALELQTAMHAATVTLNMALSAAVGATMSSLWLSRGASPWAARQLTRIRAAQLAGVALAMLTSAVLLLLESAAMADVPVTEAHEAVWSMLTATHWGSAWLIGLGALAASLAASTALAKGARGRWLLSLHMLGLAAFLYTRSMVSHAAADGDVSGAMLADWLHLMLICAWVGEVLVAGLLTLGEPVGTLAQDRQDAALYTEFLSASATFALAGIVATGAFGAWHNVGSISGLTGNAYGTTLLLKLGLVALAVMLGGVNRFMVMPMLIGTLRRGDGAAEGALRRFTLILRIEAAVLLGVLLLAAMLSSTSPPTAG